MTARGLLYIGVALATMGCVNDPDPDDARSLGPGDPLPDFEIVMSTGDTVTSQSLAGQISVITFFTTECEDCRRELPKIQKAMEENPDVRFICIAREETDPDIADYWRDNGLTLPYSPQPDRKIYSLFASSIVPRVYVISPALTITASYY